MTTKQTINGMYALLVVVAAFLATGIYFACSADDDWEGDPEYLMTHAPMMTRAGVEGGDGGYDESDLRRDCFPDKCSIWCVTKLKGVNYNNFYSVSTAAERIKPKGIGLNTAETYQLGVNCGINFTGYTSYKYIQNGDTFINPHRVIQKIKDIAKNGSLRKTIICVEGHCAIGVRISGSMVFVDNVNENTTHYDTTDIQAIIY